MADGAGTTARKGSLRATLIGGIAVLLWALLALFTAATGQVPPFQLAAMSFTIAFLVAVVMWLRRGRAVLARLRQPPVVWLIGIGGLFGYHFCYFLALRNAPAVEASLIAYLWPLLIVFFSALLPGERLRWYHVAGVFAGLAGTVLLVSGGELAFKGEYALGYAAAGACALIWSGYSVLSRRFPAVPTDVVGGYCGATAVLALLCHLGFETTVWPAGALEWLAVAGLGLGPVGAAFFVWDHGVKHGDIQALGAAAYAAPLLSTLVLIATGLAAPTAVVLIACLLITGGAVLGAGGLVRRRRTAPAG
ncbi:aromatic amino acid exporter YddG [Oceanibacterium hippocampi]|uniref:Methyl viologen resistance protein YddG n=1 Tax=Oceanibacterium hippocampi TaxID=745714 RepID=A0A1Y5RZG7_9PROT|nr:DMT family transporter [Oceanibacterium hippocampi]SLN26161.1 Methyl viologen resistance protein YddG [Oceanibacterium hippocampi]